MKERPINYSTPMVLARRDGRKTMTRRIVKPQPERAPCGYLMWKTHVILEEGTYLSPYGEPGDKLWVREEHRIVGRRKNSNGETQVLVEYLADKAQEWKTITDGDWNRLNARKTPWDRWMRARFMLRSLSRGQDVITAVRVERLQAITGQDAVAEGIEPFTEVIGHSQFTTFRDYLTGATDCAAYNSFRSLWESINGPGSWEENPWVWVVEFQRIKG